MRDRISELIRVRAGDLFENPANWRTHPSAQRAALQGMLREIGYADALIARREKDRLVLIDGHLRKSLDPDQQVPVLVVDLSEDEANTLLATLDPLSAMAGANAEALSDLLDKIHTDSEPLAELLEALARSAEPLLPLGEDDIPEAAARTNPGDLWILGDHRLLCADATSAADMARLMGDESASLLLTDPPYGVSYVGKTSRKLTIKGDDSAGLGLLLGRAFEAASGALQDSAPAYVFCPSGAQSRTFLDSLAAAGFRLRQSLVWVKDTAVLGHSDYCFRHENILYCLSPGERARGRGRGRGGWYGGNTQTSVIEVARPRLQDAHPTAKPVELIRRLVMNSSRKNQVILDPFAGSGSLLAACEQSTRRAFLMEIDPAYCDVIIARYEALTGKKASLFPAKEASRPRSKRD